VLKGAHWWYQFGGQLSNRIKLPLQIDVNLEEHDILAPKASVRLGCNGLWSRPTLAIVDTGSPFTLVSAQFVRSIGWTPPSEAPGVVLEGLGRREPGWKARMDISFISSRAQEPHLGLLLRNSSLIVTELVPKGEVLIGQHDALERLRFTQRNQRPHWDFELALS
jgi:hypothetical protein